MSVPPMTTLEFVKKIAKYHSEMKYDESRCSFIMEPYKNTATGVYFILDGDNILKIGKAEGINGLKGRVASYRLNHSKRKMTGNDYTLNRFYELMTGEFKNKILQMYIYEVPHQEVVLEGYLIKTHMARNLEKILSQQAREEQHCMLLSGHD